MLVFRGRARRCHTCTWLQRDQPMFNHPHLPAHLHQQLAHACAAGEANLADLRPEAKMAGEAWAAAQQEVLELPLQPAG